MRDEVAAAFGQLQSVFGERATIQGFDVPVTQGPNVRLEKGYGDGGTNALKLVTLWYVIDEGPVPIVNGAVNFRGLDYFIETINQHSATWEIVATQLEGQLNA
jgi:hypothetical protein